MKHYSLTVKLGEKGFTDELTTSEVIEYVKDKYITTQDQFTTTKFTTTKFNCDFNCNLDVYFVGLLNTNNPSVTIETLDYDNIEIYKAEVREFIKCDLIGRIEMAKDLLLKCNL